MVFAWQSAHGDSDATAHIVIDDFVLSVSKRPSSGSIEMAGREAMNSKRGGTSKFQLSKGKRLVKVDCVLHVPKISHKLVSVSALSDDGHTVQILEIIWVIKMRRNLLELPGVQIGCRLSISKNLGNNKDLVPQRRLQGFWTSCMQRVLALTVLKASSLQKRILFGIWTCVSALCWMIAPCV